MPGLTGRVFLVTAAIVCAVLAAALAVASVSARAAAARDARRGLEQAADLTAQLLAGRGRSLAGGARVFVQGPYFRALVAERRRDDILDQAFEGAEQLDADWVFITDERGVLLAKSDEPGAAGEQLASIPLVAGALEGRVTTGFGASRDSLLFQAVAVPIVVPGAAPVGTLIATRVVDAALARDVQAATGTDVVFYTRDGSGRRRLAATTLPRAVALALLRADARDVRDAAADDGRHLTQHAALLTAGGDPVGGFVVVRAADAIPTGLAGVRRSLLAAGALGVLLALAAAWLAALRVTRPARALAAAARAASAGDYATAARAAHLAAGGRASDEIGALASAFGALLAELREKELLVAALEATSPLQGASSAERADASPDDPIAAPRARGALVTRRAPQRAPR
ncbi:MAG: cache domain-containing protein, partial [Gemmatirosa sp.]